jgi:hypothetical protein
MIPDEAVMHRLFPISRDPPEGGTQELPHLWDPVVEGFPISRDPPEGGTGRPPHRGTLLQVGFQFLGIPPKGEH